MLIKQSRSWEIPESSATPESVFLNRRALLGGAAGLAAGAVLGPRGSRAAEGGVYPAPRNEAYTLDRGVTPERYSGDYNNFYEFGTSKTVMPAAEALKTNPWTVRIDGLVEKPFEIGVEDLVRKVGLEERLYRHRCVEAWSMAVPWTGFPLSKLLALAKPASGAKYVRFETFLDKAMAPGQRAFFYPWPYTEGLTLAEAGNDLAFVIDLIDLKPYFHGSASLIGAPNCFGSGLP